MRHDEVLATDRWHCEIKNYSAWLRYVAGRSYGTVQLRRCHLLRLRRWMSTHEPETAAADSPWAVTATQLQRWMSQQHWQPETRRAARSSVRGFYAWAIDTERPGAPGRSPALALPAVLVPRALPRPIPDPLAAAALLSADERCRRLIALAGTCGLRAMELARVNARDLVGEGEQAGLVVVGKGGHERFVPLVDPHLQAIVLSARQNPGGWLFPGRVQGHLSAKYVSVLLARALPEHWTGHTLRHRAATKAYAGTRDLRAVQELLGHASSRTTERYVAVSGAALRAVALAAAAGL